MQFDYAPLFGEELNGALDSADPLLRQAALNVRFLAKHLLLSKIQDAWESLSGERFGEQASGAVWQIMRQQSHSLNPDIVRALDILVAQADGWWILSPDGAAEHEFLDLQDWLKHLVSGGL